MANVTVVGTFKDIVSYLGPGGVEVAEALARNLPPEVQAADNLALYVAEAVHTIVAVSSVVGARPLAVVAKSGGTACVVKLYAAPDATVATTDATVSLAVSGTAGLLSSGYVSGAGLKALHAAGTGIGIAAPATDVGSGSVASDPTVYLVYASS